MQVGLARQTLDHIHLAPELEHVPCCCGYIHAIAVSSVIRRLVIAAQLYAGVACLKWQVDRHGLPGSHL